MEKRGPWRSPQIFLADSTRVYGGSGPLARVRSLEAGQMGFLSPSFTARDPGPWIVPTEHGTWSRAEISALLSGAQTGPWGSHLNWEPLWMREFAEDFGEIARLRAEGQLTKAVPVVFETARCSLASRDVWGRLVRAALPSPPELYPYGLSEGGQGFVGTTPEILVEIEGRRLRTMALAGTAALADAPRLLWDDKEIEEHEFVVRDILARLRDLPEIAEVTRAERRLKRLPTLAHLETPIEAELRVDPTPEVARRLVQLLHPTAALGVYPRLPAAEAWLRSHSERTARGSFGAPFGVWTPDGRFVALVAIRRVDFKEGEVRVGAGCGVVAESRVEREWAELALKRESIKKRLGLC